MYRFERDEAVQFFLRCYQVPDDKNMKKDQMNRANSMVEFSGALASNKRFRGGLLARAAEVRSLVKEHHRWHKRILPLCCAENVMSPIVRELGL